MRPSVRRCAEVHLNGFLLSVTIDRRRQQTVRLARCQVIDDPIRGMVAAGYDLRVVRIWRASAGDTFLGPRINDDGRCGPTARRSHAVRACGWSRGNSAGVALICVAPVQTEPSCPISGTLS